MKVLLTGGSGMVGRNISMAMQQLDCEVLSPTRAEVDLLDYSAVSRYVGEHKPDMTIHCAGLVGGIQANISRPYDFCFENLQLGLNLVRASHENEVPKLLNLGSSCMYPRNAENPLAEDVILSGELEPTNEGYAIAKVATAKLCEYLSQQYGYAYKTLIPCNLYGYWDSFSPDKSHMIPAVIRKTHQAMASGDKAVEIWGDGSARREFMFAADLADFIRYALPRFDSLPPVLNVGTGRDYTILEYYQAISEVVGYQGSFEFDLSKPAGMRQKVVDVSRLNSFGWSAPTSLKSGVELTYRHFLEEVL